MFKECREYKKKKPKPFKKQFTELQTVQVGRNLSMSSSSASCS